MIDSQEWPAAPERIRPRLRLSPAGHLALFFWSLASVFLVAAPRAWLAALIALFGFGLVYPRALRRTLRPRWLLLVGAMTLPSLFLPGAPAATCGSLSVSDAGFQMALRTALRALVILAAVDSVTSTFDVVEVAALFERAGLKGTGFALGVALNLLPILRNAAYTTWHSLRMRGGLRRQPLKGLRYYLVTVVSSAIQRAGDIALAAEARAFMPGQQRPVTVRLSPYDGLVFIAGAVVFLALSFA
jgi:energy-coupling factor transporter transmembrane protein EcfT